MIHRNIDLLVCSLSLVAERADLGPTVECEGAEDLGSKQKRIEMTME